MDALDSKSEGPTREWVDRFNDFCKRKGLETTKVKLIGGHYVVVVDGNEFYRNVFEENIKFKLDELALGQNYDRSRAALLGKDEAATEAEPTAPEPAEQG